MIKFLEPSVIVCPDDVTLPPLLRVRLSALIPEILTAPPTVKLPDCDVVPIMRAPTPVTMLDRSLD